MTLINRTLVDGVPVLWHRDADDEIQIDEIETKPPIDGLLDLCGVTDEQLAALVERWNRPQPNEQVTTWNDAIEAALLRIPGGRSCDPQDIADAIRRLKIKQPINHE